MGKLFVVGIGPGGPDGMTIAARRALEAADIVVGYTKYVELALAAVPDAAHLATPMMHEVERCRLALSRAQSGEAVALVCSGDAGVYGMASPVLELAEDYPDVDVEVIAGATAGSERVGGARRPACPRLRGPVALRPAHAVGGHRAQACRRGERRLLHLFVQPAQQKARRQALARGEDYARMEGPRHALRLGTQHRARGAAVGHVQALRAGGDRRRHVHHRVRRQR